ncbi:SipW-cognate class signal peptide [Bacillus cereus ISP3191]|uniref:CalY family protein n=1 Tax=Bacillus cereus TaxID=1396 RepID=UPI00027964D8|nr:CalY family protein [Bacillus cereus]EJQ98148.1 SipW-cognate class signal peptide [Bacillus cereus ISP3191]MDR4321838.1 cell division protein FtsN [Bacillus paranthracis]
MSLKQKVGMGVVTATLGLSLTFGGVFAYFSDSETSSNSFQAGTLDLSINPSVIIDVKDLKPGDFIERNFTLENKGTLDIVKVALETSYEVTDAKKNNDGEDLGDHIIVKFLVNDGKPSNPNDDHEILWETKLSQLKTMKPEDVATSLERHNLIDGIKSGETDYLHVLFSFEDNEQDQNKFQGDSLQLNWTFHAKQTPGTEK